MSFDTRSTASIAVLPFTCISHKAEQEFLCDGITEEIINALTKVKGLKVISRSSVFAYKASNVEAIKIGKQLNVGLLIEGSIQVMGHDLRISAQLTEVDTAYVLWSSSLRGDVDDIFKLQDQISLLIVEGIREHVGHFDIQNALSTIPTQSAKAYQYYLKGRYYQLKWNFEDLTKAIEIYEKSIAEDPGFSFPYFGKGLCLIILSSWRCLAPHISFPQAEQTLNRGFDLDEHSYISHFAKSTIAFWSEWNFSKSYTNLKITIELNPSFSEAHEALAEVYIAVGSFDLAMEEARTILSINPLSPNHYFTRGNIYFLNAQYEQAAICLDAALEIDPDFIMARELKLASLIQLNDYEGFQDFLKCIEPGHHGIYAKVFALYNQNTTIDQACLPGTREVSFEVNKMALPWHIYLHIYSQNIEMAIELLDDGLKQRSGQLIYFMRDPFFDPLRQHPRYKYWHNLLEPKRLLPEHENVVQEPNSLGQKVIGPEDGAHLVAQLKNVMADLKPYANPDISLKELAQLIHIHPNKLSRVLNEFIGKNFNDYINSYRLNAFKLNAADPALKHLSILGLAMESGFNSKTVFNTFFKREMGLAPGAWLKTIR